MSLIPSLLNGPLMRTAEERAKPMPARTLLGYVWQCSYKLLSQRELRPIELSEDKEGIQARIAAGLSIWNRLFSFRLMSLI